MSDMIHFLSSRPVEPSLGGFWGRSFDNIYYLRSETGIADLKAMIAKLQKWEADLVKLPKEELEFQLKELDPLVELGREFSGISSKNKDFLPWIERQLTKKVFNYFLELIQLAYGIHQKVETILNDPDPDEDDPDFQQFLIDLAIQSESEGPASKPSFSPRESLGL